MEIQATSNNGFPNESKIAFILDSKEIKHLDEIISNELRLNGIDQKMSDFLIRNGAEEHLDVIVNNVKEQYLNELSSSIKDEVSNTFFDDDFLSIEADKIQGNLNLSSIINDCEIELLQFEKMAQSDKISNEIFESLILTEMQQKEFIGKGSINVVDTINNDELKASLSFTNDNNIKISWWTGETQIVKSEVLLPNFSVESFNGSLPNNIDLSHLKKTIILDLQNQAKTMINDSNYHSKMQNFIIEKIDLCKSHLSELNLFLDNRSFLNSNSILNVSSSKNEIYSSINFLSLQLKKVSNEIPVSKGLDIKIFSDKVKSITIDCKSNSIVFNLSVPINNLSKGFNLDSVNKTFDNKLLFNRNSSSIKNIFSSITNKSNSVNNINSKSLGFKNVVTLPVESFSACVKVFKVFKNIIDKGIER